MAPPFLKVEKIEVLLSHSKTIIIIIDTMTEASEQMKNVVFDPICNFAGGKATEWIPILPTPFVMPAFSA